jgi:flagellar biogenesis protein FliO
MEDTLLGFVRAGLVLIGIVAGILVLYKYAGKLKLNLGVKDGGYRLKKAGGIQLGYKKFISVVEVKDYVLVVGVGEKEMTLLTKWKKEEPTA